MTDAKIAMRKAVDYLQDQLRGLHLLCITPAMIESVKIRYYGQQTPIKHLAQVSTDATGIAVKPYNPSDVGLMSNALNEAGFSSYPFSKTAVHVSVPKFITSADIERFCAHVNRLAEEARVAVRNARKQARKGLTKTELRETDKDLQRLTDAFIKEIDDLAAQKVKSLEAKHK